MRCAKGILVDVSDTFYFFMLGEGKEESEVPGWGDVGFLLKSQIPGGGWVCRRGRGRGAGRVSAANCGFWGVVHQGIFAKGIWGCTGFSLCSGVKGSETPLWWGKRV